MDYYFEYEFVENERDIQYVVPIICTCQTLREAWVINKILRMAIDKSFIVLTNKRPEPLSEEDDIKKMKKEKILTEYRSLMASNNKKNAFFIETRIEHEKAEPLTLNDLKLNYTDIVIKKRQNPNPFPVRILTKGLPENELTNDLFIEL